MGGRGRAERAIPAGTRATLGRTATVACFGVALFDRIDVPGSTFSRKSRHRNLGGLLSHDTGRSVFDFMSTKYKRGTAGYRRRRRRLKRRESSVRAIESAAG